MKKVLLSALVMSATLAITSAPVQANNIAQNLCNYVAADDKSRLRFFLKQNKLKIRTVYKGLECNGKDLLNFASSRSSLKTGLLIIAKLSKKSVKENMGSLKNPELVAAAEKRVNG